MLRLILFLSALLLGARAFLLLEEGDTAPAAVATSSGVATTLAMRETPPAATREWPPLASLSQMVKRPLFTPTRRPPVADEEPAPEPPAAIETAPHIDVTPPRVTLTAVFRTPDAELALLSLASTGNVVSVRPGDEVEGWQVDDIQSARVVLRKGSARHVVELRVFNRAVANTPPPQPQRELPTRLRLQSTPQRGGND